MRKYTDKEFIDAVESSLSIGETLKKLGVVPSGGNYHSFHKNAERLSADFSHFDRNAWARGFDFSKPKPPIEEILVNPGVVSNREVKSRLFKEGIKKHQCEYCLLIEWMGKPIPLELEHVNGDNRDNRLENLKIICPNCHALTPTYRGRNIRVKREKIENHPDFVPLIKDKNPRKIRDHYPSGIPTRIVLLNALIENSWNFTKTSDKFEVSASCIRLWCRKLDLPGNREELSDFRTKRPESINAVKSFAKGKHIRTESKDPGYEKLLETLLEKEWNFVATGAVFDVSDNSVRKWCKKYSLPSNRNDIASWSTVLNKTSAII